ncbi:hypothetical protein AJ80_07163 [Polytolypa hystricis UAMH7299]|uniref:Mesaconyl-C4 CoA hydratase n=1 Tax=Polytolypa hystricis (strain UAMH7299) TaxID=1447883 RepID=A0A2B7XRX1_POLH7|nr:hypothetical protein AJ80_07163 [Polytolypa hystricis UAMH7299]
MFHLARWRACGQQWLQLQRTSQQLRHSSSSASSPLLERFQADLTTRRIPLFYDYLSPQPSHLLDLSVGEFLSKNNASSALPSVREAKPMPIGHHLVYFPPQVRCSQLLPDGTDILHYPGPPFNRRMWAGGWVRFYGEGGGPRLNGQRAVCLEGIRDVTIRGKNGEEKVFVGLERRVATVSEGEDEQSIRDRVWTEHEDQQGDAVVVEKRNLVFMRDKTPEQVKVDREGVGRQRSVVKAPTDPAFSHIVVPTRSLLFRFSALTFNAHSIHLDRAYAQNVEGYGDVLVHGPLTLMLMLTAFQNYVSQRGLSVESIEYRNLAPLLVQQQMKICGKQKRGTNTDAWDIWIEGGQGGLAVKGTIQTRSI